MLRTKLELIDGVSDMAAIVLAVALVGTLFMFFPKARNCFGSPVDGKDEVVHVAQAKSGYTLRSRNSALQK